MRYKNGWLHIRSVLAKSLIISFSPTDMFFHHYPSHTLMSSLAHCSGANASMVRPFSAFLISNAPTVPNTKSASVRRARRSAVTCRRSDENSTTSAPN